ncbi:hypothetical protein ACFL08_01625 [Patescibacteria group bacterium]
MTQIPAIKKNGDLEKTATRIFPKMNIPENPGQLEIFVEERSFFLAEKTILKMRGTNLQAKTLCPACERGFRQPERLICQHCFDEHGWPLAHAVAAEIALVSKKEFKTLLEETEKVARENGGAQFISGKSRKEAVASIRDKVDFDVIDATIFAAIKVIGYDLRKEEAAENKKVSDQKVAALRKTVKSMPGVTGESAEDFANRVQKRLQPDVGWFKILKVCTSVHETRNRPVAKKEPVQKPAFKKGGGSTFGDLLKAAAEQKAAK